MKTTASLLLILLAILLAACQAEVPQATVAPEPTVATSAGPVETASPEVLEAVESPEATEVPTEEPDAEPTDVDATTESAAEEEPTAQAPEETSGTTTDITNEQLELMTALAPPPQLSDKELGIYIVPCLPGIARGTNEVEGEDYYCGVFTIPQNWVKTF